MGGKKFSFTRICRSKIQSQRYIAQQGKQFLAVKFEVNRNSRPLHPTRFLRAGHSPQRSHQNGIRLAS